MNHVTSLRRDNSLPLQIVHNHISSQADPAPPKPHHLTLVPVHHSLPGLPVFHHIIDKHGSVISGVTLFVENGGVDPAQEGGDDIQDEGVFADDVDGG